MKNKESVDIYGEVNCERPFKLINYRNSDGEVRYVDYDHLPRGERYAKIQNRIKILTKNLHYEQVVR